MGLIGDLFGGSDSGTSFEKHTTTTQGPEYVTPGLWQGWDEILDSLFPRTEYNFGYDSATGAPTGKQTIYQQWVEMNETQNWEDPGPELKAFLDKNGITDYKSLNDPTFRTLLESDTTIAGTGAAAGKAKSYAEMLAEDTAAQKAATDTFLSQSAEATQPYTDLLDQYVKQGNNGTGLFAKTNVNFGGSPVFSFVPRSNRALADQMVGYSKDSASNNVNLLKNALQAGLTFTPNASQTAYVKELMSSFFPQYVMASEKNEDTTGSTTESSSTFDELLGLGNMAAKLF